MAQFHPVDEVGFASTGRAAHEHNILEPGQANDMFEHFDIGKRAISVADSDIRYRRMGCEEREALSSPIAAIVRMVASRLSPVQHGCPSC